LCCLDTFYHSQFFVLIFCAAPLFLLLISNPISFEDDDFGKI